MEKLWIPSPFYKARGSYPLDMLVIHHIGSNNGKLFSLEGAITWFTDKNAHLDPKTGQLVNVVSAHYIVPRQLYKNYKVIQFVKDTDIAYHAGESSWTVDGKIRKFINSYSIGIELEGDGNFLDYTDFQYDSLITLIKELVATYNIKENNIVGHEDIAPNRKTDPGKFFDWKKLRTAVYPVSIPVPQPTAPVTIPDKPVDIALPSSNTPEFYMPSGTDNKGFFGKLLEIILKFIR